VRRSALVAGFGILLLAVLAGVVNVLVVDGLVAEGDATRTAADVLDSEQLFRLGTAALVLVVILDIVVAWALMIFFGPVDRRLSRLAAWFRLGYAAIFAVAIGQLAGVPRLLSDDRYLTTFSVEQRRTQALVAVQAFKDIWHVGLALFGIHLLLIGYLAYKSGYVPRILGALLVVAGGGYLVDTFAGLLVADYSLNVSAVTFVGEAALMLWLLIKGRTVAFANLRDL
jgi:hypothetical protein